MGIFAFAALVYASIVPLNYTPRTWDEACERFGNLRWLNLNVYRRADWVANGIVALPFSFFLAGAADRARRFSFAYFAWSILIVSCGMIGIAAIEFLQIWYPPRTISGNDVAAGCIGVLLGPIAWSLVGRPAYTGWLRVRGLNWNEQNSTKIYRWILMIAASLLLLYSVMPLDLMLSRAEWQTKWNEGRFTWIPETEAIDTQSMASLSVLCLSLGLSAGRMLPLGFLLELCRWERLRLVFLVGFPVFIEMVQAPIFTRFTTFADVCMGWGGGLLGMLLAQNRQVLLRWNQSVVLRGGLVGCALVGAFLAFLGRYQRWSTEGEIENAWFHFWAPPFSKYYYTSEFLAGSNIAGKLLVFFVIGGALANLFHPPINERKGVRDEMPHRARGWSYVPSVLVMVGMGFIIELGQIYLYPFYSDASDVLIYVLGGSGGWFVHRCLVNWQRTDAITNASAD